MKYFTQTNTHADTNKLVSNSIALLSLAAGYNERAMKCTMNSFLVIFNASVFVE